MNKPEFFHSNPWVRLVVGALLFFVPLSILILFVDRPLIGSKHLVFNSQDGESLYAEYLPGRIDSGVLLAEGFGSDLVSVTSLASAFANAGWHVFRFDFPGHGRSSGALGFDNASTDRLMRIIAAASSEFRRRSGLTEDRILGVGHSMGARVLLQAAATGLFRPDGLALLGCQVNLIPNRQAGFFTGVDDTALPWTATLSAENPPCRILLLSGLWDDVLTKDAAYALAARLNAGAGSERRLSILPALLHAYEPFSGRAVDEILSWVPIEAKASGARIRILVWVLMAAGMFLLAGAVRAIDANLPGAVSTRLIADSVKARRYLIGRALLWIPAIPIAGLLMGAAFFLPAGVPVFSLIYFGFIASGGLFAFMLLRSRSIGGAGNLRGIRGNRPWAGMLVGLASALVLAIFAGTGWIHLYPLNIRILWLAVLTPLSAFGFFIGAREEALIGPGLGKLRWLLVPVQYVPFAILAILYIVISSISGLVGLIQGLFVLMLVLRLGPTIRAAGGGDLTIALVQGFLIQFAMLPQGVLFR